MQHLQESEELQLIQVTYETGPLKQQIAKEQEPTKIFCKENSVSQSEWDAAARSGLKAEYRLTVSAFEYHGEEICEYKGKRYSIYRTYKVPNTEDLELYLGRKLGI